MQPNNYIELLVLTLKALDIDILEQEENSILKQDKKNMNVKMLVLILRSRKNEIQQKIKSYKKFITHKNKLFLLFNVSDEYYSFKQYLNKFYFYLPKYQKTKTILDNNYVLAIKSLLLLEYFLKNFTPKI